jgi:hypothetical protein
MAMLAFVRANLFAIGKVAYRELIRSYILLKAKSHPNVDNRLPL